jgi:hypothetical protein
MYCIVGSGFVRVPHPRKYDMPKSKPITEDEEDAEIYSISITHQLHCLVGISLPTVTVLYADEDGRV